MILPALALSLALRAAPPAAAVPVDDGVIALDAAPRWATAQGGYWPLRVTVENYRPAPQSLNLRVSSYNIDIQRPLSLGPSERWEGEILVPTWLSSSVTVTATREGAPPLQTDAATRERSEVCVAVSTYAIGPATTSPLLEGLSREETLLALAQRQIRSFTDHAQQRGCSLLAPEDMPDDPIAWSSAREIFIDLSAPLPAAKLATLAAWVRLGGAAAFYDPQGRLRADPEFGAWMEDRFLNAASYQLGLGAFTSTYQAASLDIPAAHSLYAYSAEAPSDLQIPIPGVNKPPIRPFAALLLALLIALGPANYLLIGRLGRPELWLITTPAISFVGTLGIGLYALISGGLDTLGASRAVALLDQRSHTLAMVEDRALWAGASPPRWFSPPAGIWHFPNAANTYSVDYEQILSPQNLLSGGFVGVRTRSVHRVLHHTTLRGRVEFEPGPRARNLLGQPAALLVWCDPAGRYWVTRDLAADQAADLRPLTTDLTDDLDASQPLQRPLDANHSRDLRDILCPDEALGGCIGVDVVARLRPGMYAARLSTDALLRNDAPATLRDAEQLLLGVVDPSEAP